MFARSAYVSEVDARILGAKEVVVPHIATKHLETVSHSALAAVWASQRDNFDLVHFHAVGPSLFSFLPRLRGIATVATIHALDWEREKWSAPAKAALRTGGRMATTAPHETISVSRGIQRYVEDTYHRRCHFIPNGVESDSRLGEPVEELVGRPFILFLGRLVPEKGRASADTCISISSDDGHAGDRRKCFAHRPISRRVTESVPR